MENNVVYYTTNQTINIETMAIGVIYGFFANGVDVLITFTNGNLAGFTANGNSTSQLISSGEVLNFQRIVNTIVMLR